MDQPCEEYTFLCGSQRIRRYGSLNDSSYSRPKHKRIIVHKVTPADTLQSLELCYKSSMFEIKRLNKLWSDQSLYCKPEVLIPIFDDDCVPNLSLNEKTDRIRSPSHNATRAENELNEETVDQLFQRIDLDVKQTKRMVKKLAKKRGQTLMEIVED